MSSVVRCVCASSARVEGVAWLLFVSLGVPRQRDLNTAPQQLPAAARLRLCTRPGHLVSGLAMSLHPQGQGHVRAPS